MDQPAPGSSTSDDADPDGAGSSASQFAPPAIALPKGGGAIRGIGEKFSANPVTGTGNLTVPIATTPGRSGFGPQMSLTYDSGAGNGPFGFGWRLSVPSITRKTDKGLPRYFDEEESDVFIHSGVEDLVPVIASSAEAAPTAATLAASAGISPQTLLGQVYAVKRYRPRIEGLFARIERWSNLATGETFWKSISKDNVTSLYGWDATSRIADPEDPARVFSWLLALTYDDRGNVALYTYKAEDAANVPPTVQELSRSVTANRYLKRIQYGNGSPYQSGGATLMPSAQSMNWCFEVVLDYGEHDPDNPTPAEVTAWPCRLDPFSTYRPCFEVRTYRLCRRVLMFHHFAELPLPSYLVRSTDLRYSSDDNPPDPVSPIYTYLECVTQTGYRWNAADAAYIRKCLPPLMFRYTQARIDPTVHNADPSALQNLPAGVDGARFRWVDLDGEGSPGVLAEQSGTWFYKRNVSNRPDTAGHVQPRFEPLERVGSVPSIAGLERGTQQLMDLAGDGHLCLVQTARPLPGYYERTEQYGWRPFSAFRELPDIDWRDPNLRTVDLNGDGFPDVLITENEVFTWYPSWARAGFGPAETVRKPFDEDAGPAVIFADGTQSIYLADMSGDGLQDLVRVRNGEICYWPNLGYGRFGAKITMGSAPLFDAPDLFEQKRIRLADIDGSGTTDVLYLGSDRIRAWFNQSGNSWSAPQTISAFPKIDALSAVSTVDLLGNGTACLVWSSPLPDDTRRPLRYIDLMGHRKPHLLIDIRNNLGAETRIQYVASTKFYLRDREQGTPWVTRLAFPVYVVERVETFDWVSRNRFVTRYTYHHGYFDGAEREFRGFGRVDQIDTEELGALTTSGSFPPATNVDAASYVPPVLTRTWFHTGAYPMGGRVSRVYAHEYFQEPGLSAAQLAGISLPDSVLPQRLSRWEPREAIRALKGLILRQEVYALDGTPAAAFPYSVTEHNYTVRLVQPLDANRHAVFYPHARETVAFAYERRLYAVQGKNVMDPRTSHTLVLAVDPFGNELQTAAIAYGRRYADADSSTPSLLSSSDTQLQQSPLATYTQNDYTTAVFTASAHRTPLPAESRSYQLINVVPIATSDGMPTTLISFYELSGLIGNGTDTALTDLEYWDFTASTAPSGTPCRRLFADRRILYQSDDLSTALALGSMQSMGLVYESYRLALTPDLISGATNVFQGIFGGQTLATFLTPSPAALLAAAGAAGTTPIDPRNNTQCGYVDLDGSNHWWIPSGRVRYSPNDNTGTTEISYAQQHFFLPQRFLDPFQEALSSSNTTWATGLPLVTLVTYDAHDLLLLESVDPRGNQTIVGGLNTDGTVSNGNDYRVMQPALITDANGNRSAAIYDALGLLVGTAVMGTAAEGTSVGDSLTGLDPDASPSAFLTDPVTNAAALLVSASTRLVYDLWRFQKTQAANPTNPAAWLPAAVATIAREIHAADPGGATSRLQISFAFSDGLQRVIQSKMLAAPADGPATVPPPGPRWLGSGWTIFNNKGKPVRQYEPFFTYDFEFEFNAVAGVSPILFYDPVGRAVATLRPDHTFEKVVFDPWGQQSWDANDTALVEDPSQDTDVGVYFQRIPQGDYLPTWYQTNSAASPGLTVAGTGTPTLAYFDPLGRMFLGIDDNTTNISNPQKYPTHTVLDIQNYHRSVIDALGRTIARYDYDLLGTKLHSNSADAGERWTLSDIARKPMLAWNSRGFATARKYDELRRPTALLVTAPGATSAAQAEQLIYGDDPTLTLPVASNLRARPYQSYDAAGLLQFVSYDFKGNLLNSARTLLPATAQYLANPVNWSPATVAALASETFTTTTAYDALNRPVSQTTPDSSVVTRTFNQTKLLQTVTLNTTLGGTTTLVQNIDYNEKAQRLSVEYGNGVVSSYTYEPETYRLSQVTTTRTSSSNGISILFSSPTSIQALEYTYDPVGNITLLQDGAAKPVIYNQQSVTASASYTYDPLYRLLSATGREQIGQAQFSTGTPTGNLRDYPFVGLSVSPNDLTALQNYLESYRYDAVGNILQMTHAGGTSTWNRYYCYFPVSAPATNNQLCSTSLPGDTITNAGPYSARYTYDADGNMATMPHLSGLQWNFKDQLQMTQQQVVNDGTGPQTFYAYDPSGQRVRKVTLSPTGSVASDRLYLGAYEVFRTYSPTGNAPTSQIDSLHVQDDKRRIALIETNAAATPTTTIRYQLSNHLGSALLELDGSANLISYEEYTPYGTSSLQAFNSGAEVSLKRYRYTGKERDEESGLAYHGVRYYAPWLARWTSVDRERPASNSRTVSRSGSCPQLRLDPGPDQYIYAADNPCRYVDQTGYQAEGPEDDERDEAGRAPLEDIVAAANYREAEEEIGKHGVSTISAPHNGETPPDQEIAAAVDLAERLRGTDDTPEFHFTPASKEALKAAAEDAAKKADSGLSALDILMRIDSHKDMQNSRIENAIRNGNSDYLRDLGLKPSEVDNMLRHDETDPLYRMTYGKAMENALARAIRSDPELRDMVIDARNLAGVVFPVNPDPDQPSLRPDFGFSSGPLQGQILDLTTPGQFESKLDKYHDKTIVLTYTRPAF